jgi:cytochrome b
MDKAKISLGAAAGPVASPTATSTTATSTAATSTAATSTAPTTIRRVTVWDLPTRLFHWLTAVLVAAAYFTWRLDQMDWHVWIGYALLTLVLFRLLWGLIGSDTARFTRFTATPARALRHLGHLFRREPDTQVGHNPAGGLMVLLLLALLLAETLTGLYSNNDVAQDGPLSAVLPAWLSNGINQAHGLLWDVLFAAIVLHLLAITLYAVAKGHNLVSPMITGRKALPATIAPPTMMALGRALLALAASAIAATLLINFL